MNFERDIKREGSSCVKYDGRKQKFGSDDVLPLWVADMDFAAPEAVQSALQKRAAHPVYGYTIYPGEYYGAIRAWMARRFTWEIKKEEILTVPSVVVAINMAIETFSAEGEGVIIQTPIYPPFLSSVRNNKRTLLENRLVAGSEGYEIDFDDFEQKAKAAKLFILCSPHNPTGRVWSEGEVQKMAQICQKHGVLIISDEIHADLVYRGTHIPIAKYAPETAVTLSGPSKTFSLTGLSSAYAIIQSDTLRRRLSHRMTQLGFHVANPFSIAATVAALQGGEGYVEELLTHLKGNLEYLDNALREFEKIEYFLPEGTFLLWLDCRKTGLEDSALKAYFVHTLGLGLNSGIDFGEAGSGFMRLNFAAPRVKLQEAIRRMEPLKEM